MASSTVIITSFSPLASLTSLLAAVELTREPEPFTAGSEAWARVIEEDEEFPPPPHPASISPNAAPQTARARLFSFMEIFLSLYAYLCQVVCRSLYRMVTWSLGRSTWLNCPSAPFTSRSTGRSSFEKSMPERSRRSIR